jgi:uncharacterized protein YaeQ
VDQICRRTAAVYPRLCADDEPKLWLRNDHLGSICGSSWAAGRAADKKACSRAQEVALFAYKPGGEIWWQQNQTNLRRLKI